MALSPANKMIALLNKIQTFNEAADELRAEMRNNQLPYVPLAVLEHLGNGAGGPAAAIVTEMVEDHRLRYATKVADAFKPAVPQGDFEKFSRNESSRAYGNTP